MKWHLQGDIAHVYPTPQPLCVLPKTELAERELVLGAAMSRWHWAGRAGGWLACWLEGPEQHDGSTGSALSPLGHGLCVWLALPAAGCGVVWRWERPDLWVNEMGGIRACELEPSGQLKVFFGLFWGDFLCVCGKICKTKFAVCTILKRALSTLTVCNQHRYFQNTAGLRIMFSILFNVISL